MENASAAFLEAVRRSMRPIRMALGSTVIDPALLTHAERLQHDGHLRREEAYGAIRTLAQVGTPIREIVRRTGRSRKLVREIVRGGGGDVFRCRSNTLEPHLAWLDAEWSAGCRNGAELWRRLRATGFRGSLRVVAEWATRRRRAERAGRETLRKVPPARVLSHLMLSLRDHLTKEDAITVASIERACRFWCRPATWSSASIGWYATVIPMLCPLGSQMPPAACLRPSARASLPIKPQSSQP